MHAGASCKIAFRIWKSVRARLQSCRKRPIPIPALAAAELQTIENKKDAGASMRRLVVSSRFCFCFFIHGVFVFAFVVAVVFCLSRQIHLGLLYALAGSRSGLGA
jgi:hypothetical protein